MEFASLYGSPDWTDGGPDTTVAQATGPAVSDKGPALYFAAIIGLLVLARIAYEMAE